METWQQIEGHENYEISNYGRVRNRATGKMRSTHDDQRGYEQVNLYTNGKKHSCKVHRLVANAFIPNPDNLPQINHIDGNKWNNCADNLEWCSQADNLTHDRENGLNNCNRRRVIDTETGHIYNSICEGAEAIGMSESGLRRRLNKGQGTLKYYD